MMQLASIKEILSMYSRALSGVDVEILSTKDLVKRAIGWTSVESATTDGTIIYLPESIENHGSEQLEFEFYKVLATHQVGHLEFGTFDFSFEKPSTWFRDARPLLEKRVGNGNNKTLSDFERFFDLFSNRKLARDLFNVAEDYRIDNRIQAAYHGIRQPYFRVLQDSLQRRPRWRFLPQRQALVECLILLSLGDFSSLTVATPLTQRLLFASQVMERLRADNATVEDSAEATIRLYLLAVELPNTKGKRELTSENANPKDLLVEKWSVDELESIPNLEKILQSDNNGVRRLFPWDREDDNYYESPKEVGFRGSLKAELVQTVNKLKKSDSDGAESSGEIPLLIDLKETLNKSVEAETETSPYVLEPNRDLLLQNLMRESERGFPHFSGIQRKKRYCGNGPCSVSISTSNGSKPAVFKYDEWDYHKGLYIPSWCEVRQHPIEEGTGEFFDAVQLRYPMLVHNVMKRFERLRVESFRKMKRLYDGDELDLDSAIEFIVERRAGVPASDKVYSRRDKAERDVAVLFLLDMSGSTFEIVKSSGDSRMWGQSKTIIELEKESLVIMVKALEAIGDKYGIYGFSGHGRDNVEFLVIKDFMEDFSPKIKRRFDKIRPLHATRMGPAIRHAVSILDEQEAKLRLLILLSDGRPHDIDYGQGKGYDDRKGKSLTSVFRKLGLGSKGVDEEERKKLYALNDTRMALLEAKQHGIVPFCLTVDRFGHDYLEIMCGDIGYEVLDSVESLPEHLPKLYRSLAA